MATLEDEVLKRALMLILAGSLSVACDKPAEKSGETTQTNEAPATNNDATPEPAETAAAEEPAGQWVVSESYAVKFRVPDDWKVKKGESSLSATSPDDTITVLLVGTEGEGVLSAALDSIKKEVQFKDMKLEKDAQTVVNGMPGHTAAGSAVLVQEAGDQEIQFLMNAVQAGDKGVALMVFAEAEMYEARKEEVEGLLKTLQKS